MNPKLSVQQRKKLDELWDKSQKIITEMTLFEHAIKLRQLDIVELLSPYCSNSVSLKFYNDMLLNAINSDKDFEKVFDFLSENCPIFNNMIHQQIRLYYRLAKNSPVAHNILYQAYIADNKKLFTALLKYGVNPVQPWVIAENIAYPALYAIFDTEFGEMHEEFATTPEYTPHYEQGLTQLIAMMYYNKGYFRYSKLFEAIVQNSDISSALAALSSIATNIHCHLSFLFIYRNRKSYC